MEDTRTPWRMLCTPRRMLAPRGGGSSEESGEARTIFTPAVPFRVTVLALGSLLLFGRGRKNPSWFSLGSCWLFLGGFFWLLLKLEGSTLPDPGEGARAGPRRDPPPEGCGQEKGGTPRSLQCCLCPETLKPADQSDLVASLKEGKEDGGGRKLGNCPNPREGRGEGRKSVIFLFLKGRGKICPCSAAISLGVQIWTGGECPERQQASNMYICVCIYTHSTYTIFLSFPL